MPTSATRQANLVKRHAYYAGAAIFWGECIARIDAGEVAQLRADLLAKLAKRLADADRLEQAVKKADQVPT